MKRLKYDLSKNIEEAKDVSQLLSLTTPMENMRQFMNVI